MKVWRCWIPPNEVKYENTSLLKFLALCVTSLALYTYIGIFLSFYCLFNKQWYCLLLCVICLLKFPALCVTSLALNTGDQYPTHFHRPGFPFLLFLNNFWRKLLFWEARFLKHFQRPDFHFFAIYFKKAIVWEARFFIYFQVLVFLCLKKTFIGRVRFLMYQLSIF